MIDVLVNNAGIMRQTGGIPDAIEEWDAVWQETMTVNVHAPVASTTPCCSPLA